MKTWVKITKKQELLYKKLGADPEVVLSWIHKEICKILEENLDPYGTINNLDEEDLAEWIILSAKLKKNRRLKIQSDNKHEKIEREKRKERIKREKSSDFYKNLAEEV